MLVVTFSLKTEHTYESNVMLQMCHKQVSDKSHWAHVALAHSFIYLPLCQVYTVAL